MPLAIIIKDHRREQHLLLARILQAAGLVFLLLLILLARLFYLQVINHDKLATLSTENRFKVVAAPPTRGLLFDRNGRLLAENKPVYSLTINPQHTPDIESTLAKLSNLITVSPAERERFFKLKKSRPPFEHIPLRITLNDQEVAQIAARLHTLPGVDIIARPLRFYPHKEHAAHLIGYIGRISEPELAKIDQSNYLGTDHIGKSGIEQYYEDKLHGKTGIQQIEINAQGRVLRVFENKLATPGNNLYLTIDSKLQQLAEQALADQNGAVVAIEPKTGEVLVFASQPSYDPNLFVDGISLGHYQNYSEDENRPLYNRALYGRYPPGSTIKPFVALAGLETRAIDLTHQTRCRGYYQLPGKSHRYRDWKKNGHGVVSINKSIVESCDIFYYELANKLKIDPLHHYMTSFGFGQKTGIDLVDPRFEPSGLFPSSAWKKRVHKEPWYPGETVITGIGQGFTLVTPLQLAQVTATLANRGIRIKPRLIRAIENQETGIKQIIPRSQISPVDPVSKANWDTVIQAMHDVVHSAKGTARKLNHDIDYTIAGKTGTAQVISIEQDQQYDESQIATKHRDHALFIAFAPVVKPKIAIAVIVENGGAGSKTAAPIAGKIINAWLSPSNSQSTQSHQANP